MTNTYQPQRPPGWSLLDVAASPVFNVLETVSNLPGVRDTGLNEWLYTAPLFQGAQEFQAEHPGWAVGADIAASFIPFIGWGTALNRARVGAGLLGGIQGARLGAAGAFRSSPALAFAAGETVAYTPLVAGLTAFDLAGGRYESPWDALTSFGLGTALGAGLAAGGHALSPLVRRAFPPSATDIAAGRVDSRVASLWSTAFEPGPELSRLYGFSDNVRRSAEQASRSPLVQSALDPTNPPQIIARRLMEIREGINAGTVTDVDPMIVDSQIDTAYRAIVFEEPDTTANAFNIDPALGEDRTAFNRIQNVLSTGEHVGGTRVTLPLTSSADTVTNPQVLQLQLGLHDGWLADVQFPRIHRVQRQNSAVWLRSFGFDVPGDSLPPPSGFKSNFRRVQLERPGENPQLWVARPEHTTDGSQGMWLLGTRVPADPDAIKVNGKEAYQFLFFKTREPQRFLPHAFQDADNAGVEHLWYRRSNLDKTESDLLKQLLDYQDIYTNPKTIHAMQRSMMARGSDRQKIIHDIIAGPTLGREIAANVRRIAAPTIQQFNKSPLGKSIWGMYRSTFEGLEGRVRRQLHGEAVLAEDVSPLASLFLPANINDTEALFPALRKVVRDDPNAAEIIRKVLKRDREIDLASIEGLPVGQWLRQLEKLSNENLKQYDKGIESLQAVGATDAKIIPERQQHFGVSRNWDGSVFIPLYKKGDITPSAVRAGGSQAHAERKAREWIEAANAEKPGDEWRMGKAWVQGSSEEPPGWLLRSDANPNFLRPRQGLRGYEHEFEPYKHIDDLIKEIEDNYVRRARYFATIAADALTAGQRNQLRTTDEATWKILNTRIAQLVGQPLAFEEWQNRVLDEAFAKHFGTKTATKTADALNEVMFHSLHGVGYLGTPVLNLTSILQTHLPQAIEMLTSTPDELRHLMFQIPWFDSAGKPRPGFHPVVDAWGLIAGGFKQMMNPSDETREVVGYLANHKIMGGSLANEFMGQDRLAAVRASEGIRGPEDVLYWARRVSSFLMAKTEEFNRYIAAGMSLEVMQRMEASFPAGIKFSTGQKVQNAINMVERAAFGYMKQDRPLMFSTPLGSVFGNQKTWMVNYLWMLMHYFGLAQKGNVMPLMFSLGTTTALGGIFAVPVLGAGFDTITELLEDKDGREYIFEHLGEGGNAISFGLPALFGMSMSGNVAAPGSNLAHDAEFMFSVVAIERAKLIGRALGRAVDDQLALGINPLSDRTFRQQLAQGLAPRSMYRAWEALSSSTLHSAATGYPLVRNMGFGARLMHGLGFRDVDIALQYETYASLLKDRDEMRRRISLFGEAYARASMENDRDMMLEILQNATVQGLDINSIMRSAQTRMRNAGRDMFGRNFNEEQLARYQESLAASGRQ